MLKFEHLVRFQDQKAI
jgi:hypothetical protein